MRRLLLPAAVVLAVLGAGAVLWPSWVDRARESQRARSRTDSPTVARPVGDAATTDAAGGSGAATVNESSASASVRGVVTGPKGVLWAARVVAYRAGTGDVLAETHTNPEGAYALGVDADVAFDLAVEPADITGLLAWRREGAVVAAGEEIREDVALGEGAVARGRLVDENGDPVSGIVLRAVPEDPSAPGVVTHASHAAGLAKSQRGDGAFVFRGLPPGRYALDVYDRNWMFPAPVSVFADGREVDLVIVPGVRVDLSVKDIETGDAVAAFTARATSGELVLFDVAGTDGAFATCIRLPAQLAPRERLEAVRRVSVEIAAPGFHRSVSEGSNQVVWMIPVRDGNTTIHVGFDDGDPYLGELGVTVKSKATGGVGRVPFERDPKPGLFRGALPWGDWEVTIIPSDVYYTDRYAGDARTGEGLEATLEVTLPGGGTIVFTPPPGADHAMAHLRRSEARNSGVGASVVASYFERSFAVPREGARVGGIPPGTYQVGVTRMVEVQPGRTIAMVHYFGDVRMDAKSLERITLPE